MCHAAAAAARLLSVRHARSSVDEQYVGAVKRSRLATAEDIDNPHQLLQQLNFYLSCVSQRRGGFMSCHCMHVDRVSAALRVCYGFHSTSAPHKVLSSSIMKLPTQRCAQVHNWRLTNGLNPKFDHLQAGCPSLQFTRCMKQANQSNLHDQESSGGNIRNIRNITAAAIWGTA